MKAHNKETQAQMTPRKALQFLQEGNDRFINNLKGNKNLQAAFDSAQTPLEAQKFVKELQSKGFSNATVIEPEKKGKLIKVAANAYHNENEAYTQSTSIKSKLRASAWIFKSSKK